MARRRSRRPASLLALILAAILGWVATYFQGKGPEGQPQQKPTPPAPTSPIPPQSESTRPPSRAPSRDSKSESSPDRPETLQGWAAHVKDGDSFVLREGNEDRDIRLWGIDSPEGNTRQPYAPQARDFARQLYQRKKVSVVVRDRDQYGRIVGEAFLPDGTSINEQMLEAGWAWHFRRHAPKQNAFAAAEARARQAGRGLWQDADPIPPWDWRRDHRSVPKP